VRPCSRVVGEGDDNTRGKMRHRARLVGSHIQFMLWPKIKLLKSYTRDGHMDLVVDANDKGTTKSLVVIRWRKRGIGTTITIGRWQQY